MRDASIISRIERRVEESLRESHVKSILAAVSGGADSMALLAALSRLAASLGIKVECVNCNFHLRGEESDRDSLFVAEACTKIGIPLHRLDFDVAGYMADNPGKSMEMACRELRYDAFFQMMEEGGFDRTAVAHNSDDDIETMLLSLMRGSGSRGLKGMERDNGRVLRPLLSTSRNEIERYLSALGIGHITDSSNLTSDFRRNFLRLEVIPLLESRWPGAKKSMLRSIRIAKEESMIVDRYYSDTLGRLLMEDDSLDVYSKDATTGLVARHLEKFGGNAAIAEEIIEATTRRYERRNWRLSEEYEAILDRDRLRIYKFSQLQNEADASESESVWTSHAMSESLMTDIKRNNDHRIIYLPYGKERYSVRRPAEGDRMHPLGMKGSRLVSDIISDAKLSEAEKRRIRVLTRISDGAIISVIGLKRSREDLLTSDMPTAYRAFFPDKKE